MRKKLLFFCFSLILMNLMIVQNYSFALENAADLSAIDNYKHSKEEFQAYIDELRAKYPETEKQIVVSIYNAFVEAKGNGSNMPLDEVAKKFVEISNSFRDFNLGQVAGWYVQSDKVGAYRTGLQGGWAQVILGLIVLGILLSLVGGFLGLNLLVVWTFVGVAIISELVLSNIGLGLGGYDLIVTICLSLGAATWVYLKTG